MRTPSKFAKMLIVVELIVVSYLLYTLTFSVYRSYQIDLIISEFESENNRIADENRKKLEDYEYYTSDNYVEKIAKQNFGLVNPGESVIVITQGASSSPYFNDDKKSGYDISRLSNLQKWQVFFFDIY